MKFTYKNFLSRFAHLFLLIINSNCDNRTSVKKKYIKKKLEDKKIAKKILPLIADDLVEQINN